jgi:phosphatidylglycerol lysyltransferase
MGLPRLARAGRPPENAPPASAPSRGASERADAEAIVRRHGRTPLDYFKLWPDKSYHFSQNRQSLVAYRVAWSVAVSLGDPVGPASELEPMVRSFLDFSARHAWRAAFLQVPPDLIPVYSRQGFDLLKIGEVALVDLKRFAGETVHRPHFRKPRHRLAATGYVLTYAPPPHPVALLDEAAQVSREWLSLPGRCEHGFALGRFERSYLAQHPIVGVRDPAGRLVAFANQVPGIRPGVATVDLMRHRPDVPNGVMDYLFSEFMLVLEQEGYRWFCLGLAPLAGVGDHPGADLRERLAHAVYEHLSHLFSFKGLRHYKAKFEPVWEERFLAYQHGLPGLVRTALALGCLARA